MKKGLLIIILITTSCFSQKNLNKLLKKYNQETIPYIYVNDLKDNLDNVFLLDAREPKEFEVSHLNNAICVGYDNFDLNHTLEKLPKNKKTKIVVYCSLGIRSEDVAEKIKAAGYTNIFNLYGGIFEWKNNDNNLVNPNNQTTDEVL